MYFAPSSERVSIGPSNHLKSIQFGPIPDRARFVLRNCMYVHTRLDQSQTRLDRSLIDPARVCFEKVFTLV